MSSASMPWNRSSPAFVSIGLAVGTRGRDDEVLEVHVEEA